MGVALKRSLACANPELYRLTPTERGACDLRDDEAMRQVRPLKLTLPPARAEAWDEDIVREQGRSPEPFVPCGGPGANLGVGCPNER